MDLNQNIILGHLNYYKNMPHINQEGDLKNFEKDIAMQTRCVHCKMEQYTIAVYKISLGEMSCVYCGKLSKLMTEKEYLNKLNEKD